MKQNETLIHFQNSSENSGYRVYIYDSTADFRHRAFFEHRHADFELSLVLAGEGIYRLQDGVHSIKAGDIMLFGSNQIHCVTDVVSAEPMVLLNVQFEPRLIWSPYSNLFPREVLKVFNDKSECFHEESPIRGVLYEKMLAVRLEANEKQAGYATMIKAYLCEIFTILMRHFGVSVADGEDAAHGNESLVGMERAMIYLNSRLHTPLSLETLACVAGYTRTYFSTLFKALNGLTPWEYINICRIEKCKRMLRETDLPIIEIAASCGYQTIPNFNRLFARITGTTPRNYRKEAKKNER